MATKRNPRRQHDPRVRTAAALAGPLAAVLALSLPASPAAAAVGNPSARVPELSIAVTDGRQNVKPGDLLTYAVKIRNIGKQDARRLRVVQTLPGGLKLISASRHPATGAGQLIWRLNLAAGRSDTFRVVGRVGRTPPQLLRLATVACANLGGGVRPIVCAAHSDELPAGAAAAAAAVAHAHAAAVTRSRLGYLRPLGAAVALVTVAGGCWLVIRRRRRA